MSEYKGKCKYKFVEFLFGLFFTIAFLLVSILFVLRGNYWILLIMAILIFASIQVFLMGLSDFIYASKIVLKIYDDQLKFISHIRFNTEWQSCKYEEIREFEVILHDYVTKQTKNVNKKSGHIYFKIGMGKEDYCWVDIDNCFTAARQILQHLNKNQISKDSELNLNDIINKK